jgi:hypothetical protein
MVCEQQDGKLVIPVPEIDYSYLRKDLFDEAHQRLLWQFRNSENICEYLTAIFTETQLIFDTVIDVLDQRQLAKASGEQLDVIGRIVGQDRVVVGASESLFGFADDATALPFAELVDGELVGGGRFLELGEPESGTRELTDGEYRQFIIAKIYRNHMKTASACELAAIANTILTSVVRTQVITIAPAMVAYYFEAPGGLTPDDIAIISSVIDDNRADRQRIITAGAGIGIGYFYQQTEDNVFGFADDPDPAVKGFSELEATDIMFGFNDSPTPKGWFTEKEGTAGAGIYADRPNKDTLLTTILDESNAGTWAEIIA